MVNVSCLEAGFIKRNIRLSTFLYFVIALPLSAALTNFTTQNQTTILGSKKCNSNLQTDSDIHGPGVRTSYYVQYFAALFALAFGLRDEMIGLRKSFITVTVGVLLSL